MPTDAPFTPPKKKPSVFRWIGGAFTALVMFFVVQRFIPSPRIIISKQTTYITEPLLETGLPNYEQYVREKYRESVTPENNAGVLLFQALWPAELKPEHYESVAAELGLKEIPLSENAMQLPYGDATKQRVLDWLPKSGEGQEEPDVEAIIGAAENAAWTSEQLPPLAEWVAENRGPLDKIVEASRRPRLYLPSPTLLNDDHELLIEMLLPGTQALRSAARGLSIRAAHHIGENRLNEAWQDILASHRLAHLTSQGPTMVDQLVAVAISGVACHGTAILLSSDQLTEQLARQIQDDLTKLPPFDSMAASMDETERIWALDAVVYASIYGFDALSKDGQSQRSRSTVNYASVDWNVVLRRVNKWFDRIVAAVQLPHGDARRDAIAKYESDLEADGTRKSQPTQIVAAFLSRTQRSEMIGAIISNLMLPALGAAMAAEDRENAIQELTQLAAALAVYRAQHGQYPEKLGDLVPAVLSALPVDLYCGKPFVYKRIDNGYLLYSTGENGQDESGSSALMDYLEGRRLSDMDVNEASELRDKIPNKADDVALRMPIPPFKLPKPAKP